MKALIVIVWLLAAPSVLAATAEERCRAAIGDVTKLVLQSAAPDSSEESAKNIAAQKRAFRLCTDRAVPAELRNEAIARWAGMDTDRDGEIGVLKKALRETEATEGTESRAVLPLIDSLAGIYAVMPQKRREALELYERSLAVRKKVSGENSIDVVNGLLSLGRFWAIEDLPDRDLVMAEHYYRQAVAAAEKADGSRSETLFTALASLHTLIREQPGREAEAARINDQLEQIYAATHPPSAQ